jgi:hypothetical protein
MLTTITAELNPNAVFNAWAISLLVTVGLIVVVVALIYGITRNALAIDQDLDEAVVVGKRILANTDPLFALEKTAALGATLLEVVKRIEADAGTVLELASGGNGRR